MAILEKFHPNSIGSSKNQTLTANISRMKKDFDMRFFSADFYGFVLHSDEKSSKIIKPFLIKSSKKLKF